MTYLRSFLAGVAATVITEILVIIAAVTVSITAFSQPRNVDTTFVFVGWDPISFARTAPGWGILVLAFVVGFWWQYRRLAVR